MVSSLPRIPVPLLLRPQFLVVDKDNEAFARTLLNSNNRCYVFREGAVVEIESTAKLDGVEAECVRLRGDPNCYWMATKFSHISP
jgi:hypothetical protein